MMSHMCADAASATRRSRALKTVWTESLAGFDRIPASKWGVIPLISVCAAGRSVAVFTESSGNSVIGYVAL